MYFVNDDIVLACVLEFKAESESVLNPLLRSFTVKALTDSVEPSDEEHHVCPVWLWDII